MSGRRGIGLNEIMIVNPSSNGRNGMLNRTNGHYGQPEDEESQYLGARVRRPKMKRSGNVGI